MSGPFKAESEAGRCWWKVVGQWVEVSAGGLPKPVIQKAGAWGQEAGVGDSHSQVHSWR